MVFTYEEKITACLQQALRAKKANQDRASLLLHLRRKKLYTTHRDKYLDQLALLEDTLEGIRTASLQQEVIASLHAASGTLRRLREEQDVDEVEEVVQSLQEMRLEQDEVSEALTTPVSEEEEMELEEELRALEREVEKSLSLPSVPASKPRAREEKKKEEKKEEKKQERKQEGGRVVVMG